MVRIAVVTGGNKGIGFAIVRGLCKQFDGDVILTARNPELGQGAVTKLEEEGLEAKFHQLDTTSAESIATMKLFLETTYGGLDVLVNNAGIAFKSSTTTPFLEQAKVTLRTNFTGTLDVCRALLPLVRPHGRVVNISATNGRLSILKPHLQEKFSNPELTEQGLVALVDQFVADVASGDHTSKGWANTAYGTGCLAVIALTKILAREIAKSSKEDVLVNTCCPGWVRTDMAGPSAPLSPDQGAVNPVYVALLPEGSPSGQFWKKCAVADWTNPPPIAKD